MARIFVAAWPNQAVISALRDLPRPELPGIRWTRPEQWHVTLRFLGDADPGTVHDRLTGVELPAGTVRLGPAIGPLGPHQLVIPASGADHLAMIVRDATTDIGEPAHHRFRGHLTIGRARRGVELPQLGTRFEASFPVDSIAIVGSDLTTDGARYTTLATIATTTGPVSERWR